MATIVVEQPKLVTTMLPTAKEEEQMHETLPKQTPLTPATAVEAVDTAVNNPKTDQSTPPQHDNTANLKNSTAVNVNAQLRANAIQRLQIQIQFVENARKLIEQDTHPDLVARYAKCEQECQELLELAKVREEYWHHCTSVIFAYECEEATSEYMAKCEKLRHDMLDEIHSEMEIIQDQRKGGNGSFSTRKTTRKTRSSRAKGSGNGNGDGSHAHSSSGSSSFALDTAEKIKKRAGYVFRPLEKKLAQSEVDHDVRELSMAFEASKKRRMENTDAVDLPFARYHRAKFLYQDLILQEGDEVYVQNQINGNAYVAIICAITSTEIFVLSEKGKYHRLVIMDIRHGKIVLDVLTQEQSDALLADGASHL